MWAWAAIALGGVWTAGGLGAQEVVELPGEDRPLALELEPVRTVGGLEAPPWAQFASLTAAAFDDEGRLYLVDARDDRVVVVGDDGRHLHDLGRPGEGPGELAGPVAAVPLGDGRVVVWDSRKRALIVFDGSGELIREARPAYDAGLPHRPFFVGPDGALRAAARRLIMDGEHAYFSGAGTRVASEGLPVLRVPLVSDGSVEVVARLPMPDWEGPGSPPMTRAFEPDPSWGLLEGGVLALQFDDGYAVHLRDPEGGPLRVLRRPFPVREVGGSERRAFRDDMERRFQEGEIFVAGAAGSGPGAARAYVEERMADAHFHDVLPPILEMRTDGRRLIWVRRRSVDDPMAPGPVDVLTVDGRYLGTLTGEDARLPDAFGPDGLVVYLEAGELDVPLARVYRMATFR